MNAPLLATVAIGAAAFLGAVGVAQAIHVRDLRAHLDRLTERNQRLIKRRRKDSDLIAGLRAIHSSEVDVLTERLGTAEEWLDLFLTPQSPATVDDEFDRLITGLEPPIAPQQREADQ